MDFSRRMRNELSVAGFQKFSNNKKQGADFKSKRQTAEYLAFRFLCFQQILYKLPNIKIT